ncbi:MAG: tRNA (N6-isopentenyl adenosine(37)-C2)-methylthiotransferase MiaB [Ruminococcaceae bacterium]|nr:tRNA (N6-isopentenyl adenosine(37)-C2)-methylthiotransferase MiaB [Oscillospiraceae bacterium]
MLDFNGNFMADDAELREQFSFALRVSEILKTKYSTKPLAFVHTYGCQQNVSDSERLKGLLELMGYGFTEELSEAQLVLYNTCAVREHAEDRVFGNVGILKALKRENPDLLIIVCGCMAQQPEVAEKIKKSYPYVDILFGTHVRHRLPEFVYKRLNGSPRIFCNPDGAIPFKEGVPLRRDGTFKAWLPIMEGCNNFCSYCIVPYTRGREVSREPEAVLREAKMLIVDGAKEIMLLGQNVNSYGKGNKCEMNFAGLLRAINALPGDFRIRFMTSHPKDCSEELLVAMSECEKVERHLHLPVQSGSDRILKAMNRVYDTEKYLSLVRRARELMPDIEFTSDIIVGFPGETYEDFKCTLELIKEVRYYALFTFIFSPRPGTPAAKMPEVATKAEKSKWFTEMLKVQEKIAEEIDKAAVGRKVRLLIEDEDNGRAVGRSSENYVVILDGEQLPLGEFVDAEITHFDGKLHGKLI